MDGQAIAAFQDRGQRRFFFRVEVASRASLDNLDASQRRRQRSLAEKPFLLLFRRLSSRACVAFFWIASLGMGFGPQTAGGCPILEIFIQGVAARDPHPLDRRRELIPESIDRRGSDIEQDVCVEQAVL